MGFSAPKPDPAIAAQQAASAAEAKRNKISAIQDQLGSEDRVRTKLYGAKPNPLFSNFGTPPPGQDPNVTAGLRGLAGYMLGGGLKSGIF